MSDGWNSETAGGQNPLRYPLSAQLREVEVPLAQAFDSRCRALNCSGTPDVPTAALLATLLRCVEAGDDVEGIVSLSSETAARHQHARSTAETYRNAVEALDWAIRDLQLNQYTAEERERFSTSTALFVELLRRATGEAHPRPESTDDASSTRE